MCWYPEPFASPSTRWDTDPSDLLLLSLKTVSEELILIFYIFLP